MPKKDKKSAKKKDGRDPSDVVDAVRGAVERTLSGGDGGRNLLDDVASAAQRIRESFDDLRVLEDVRGLRAEVEALSRRVAELEKQAAKPATAPATKPATPSASKPSAAARPTARKPARKPPAKASAAGTAAAKTGPKPKPKPAPKA